MGGPMIWKVINKKINKILCHSSIWSTLDPLEQILTLDPLKTTDFKLVEPSVNDPSPDIPIDLHYQVVYFRNQGEENFALAVVSNKFKSVITDENREPKKDPEGNIMYRMGPHPNELPGSNISVPHPDSGLPSHITIRKLVGDY